MLRRALLSSFAVLGMLAIVGDPAAAEPPGRAGILGPCNEEGMPPEALCGTYEVFENRDARTGRKIPLRIVVLPATGPSRLPDPVVFFAGGPGEASIPAGFFMARKLSSLRQKRDVLLIDLRGTGRSGGLFCPELKDVPDVQGFLDEFMPTDRIRACRDRLKKEADLAWYTSDAVVDDVEEVRTALGYGPLNLMGISHGTRLVLTSLRRHPQSVRTATLDGVLPPDERVPLGAARFSQETLDALITECEGDAACRGAFPNLRQDVGEVLRHAASAPVGVELINPRSGRPGTLRLSHAAVVQTLRAMLYSPVEAAFLPLRVHQAAQGDWKPLARSAQIYGEVMSGMAEGFYQSVTCAEDVAFIRDSEVGPAVAGTFLGDFRVRRQKAGCEGWPVRDLGADLQAPVVSEVPSLLISGERDPATPAAGGDRVARTLKRSRHVIVPDAGHDTAGMQGEDCLDRLIAAFIEAGTADGLDTTCVARMRRPDFELPAVTVARADLEQLQGSYTNEEMGVVFKLDLQESGLQLTFTQGAPFPPSRLVPTSPTRFRVEGDGLAPGLAVALPEAGVKPATLSILQPGKPEVVMKRVE